MHRQQCKLLMWWALMWWALVWSAPVWSALVWSALVWSALVWLARVWLSFCTLDWGVEHRDPMVRVKGSEMRTQQDCADNMVVFSRP